MQEKIEKLKNKKIAIVCDWIKDWGGAELVLSHMLEIFPKADIFTSVFFQKNNPVFEWKKITTSFIQKIPILNKSHKLALTLRPLAFESFDLSEYDIVISSTSAESKWVITKPETLFICYCHTPTRYFWSHFHEYLWMMEFWILNFLWKSFAPRIIHKLRIWDFVASQRPDYFLANSINTKNRIKKYYKREAKVIYPWIEVEKFSKTLSPESSLPDVEKGATKKEKEDFYLYVWRCIPYKKFDLIVDSFNKNWKKVILVTNTDNKLYRDLKVKSKKNIIWKLNISRKKTRDLFTNAKAFLFPPEEDFWLVPIEAQAWWTPIIAYGSGWALETVVEWKTGIFFEEQTVESFNQAIEKFEKLKFDSVEIRKQAEKFDKKKFQEELLDFVIEKLKK